MRLSRLGKYTVAVLVLSGLLLTILLVAGQVSHRVVGVSVSMPRTLHAAPPPEVSVAATPTQAGGGPATAQLRTVEVDADAGRRRPATAGDAVDACDAPDLDHKQLARRLIRVITSHGDSVTVREQAARKLVRLLTSNGNGSMTEQEAASTLISLLTTGEKGGMTQQERDDCLTDLVRRTERELFALRRRLDSLARQRPHEAYYPEVRFRPYEERRRILVTGGAGFVGSHLVDRLMLEGHEVTVVDNLHTGRKRNVEHWLGHENFQLFLHDIVNPYYAEVDQIYHLASPASPPHYMANPVKTIKTNTVGTINMLGLAKRVGARILIASTSEVYGDPEQHPQEEGYWGHVNPIGPRACYDEAKRVAETLAVSYQKNSNVSICIARIFNTYGPRMHNNDGRVVSNFILQALQNQTLTVYGSGEQTRSFQYVSDLVEGLVALMNSNYTLPVNLGNPAEHTINEFARIISNTLGSSGKVEYLSAMEDDPQKRRPNISLAKRVLDWEPKVPLNVGIPKTAAFFKQELDRATHSDRNYFDPLIDWAHVLDTTKVA